MAKAAPGPRSPRGDARCPPSAPERTRSAEVGLAPAPRAAVPVGVFPQDLSTGGWCRTRTEVQDFDKGAG